MTAGVVAVVVIALGLPLLAFWLGGRRFWSRLRSRSLPGDRFGELYRDMVRKHGLRPAEIAKVENAATWGRRLDEPRLRAAVVDWAGALRADTAARRAAHPRRGRVLALLFAVWLSAGVTTGVVAGQGWSVLVRLAVYALLLGVPGILAVRGPRRAIELNSDGPPSAGVLGEQPR